MERSTALHDLSRAGVVGISQLVQDRPEYFAIDVQQMVVAVYDHAPDLLQQTRDEGNLTADILAWYDAQDPGDAQEDPRVAEVFKSLREWLTAHG